MNVTFRQRPAYDEFHRSTGFTIMNANAMFSSNSSRSEIAPSLRTLRVGLRTYSCLTSVVEKSGIDSARFSVSRHRQSLFHTPTRRLREETASDVGGDPECRSTSQRALSPANQRASVVRHKSPSQLRCDDGRDQQDAGTARKVLRC